MFVSTDKHWIKNISFCSLKYGDHKNKDGSLTYPNINEKRKQIDMVSGLGAILLYTAYKCQKIQQVA